MAIGVHWWQALTHDWSKFLPSELIPYAQTFYQPDGSRHYVETDTFQHAWNAHVKRQPHHWQYWLLPFDRGETKALDMPEKYIKEMVADWAGASMAQGQGFDPSDWYYSKATHYMLHERTRVRVEYWLDIIRIMVERGVL
jgi:hypothetical protein